MNKHGKNKQGKGKQKNEAKWKVDKRYIFFILVKDKRESIDLCL